jgi:ribosomal protein S27AE
MADGRLNKCKNCTKKDVAKHREKNIERIRAYDRTRGNRQVPGYFKEYRKNYPNKYKAHNMVNNAIRDGKLFKKSCGECGSKRRINAHHDNYTEPLNVRWLCASCHHQWHAENGEARNP